MTILVSHQAVPPHFTPKLRPCSCWCVAPAYASHQYCFCITKKTFRALFLQFRDINIGCFKIKENCLAVDFMINALQSIWNLDRNSLHVSVRQCAPPFDLSFTFVFLSVSCLPQSFDVRMPSFLSHYWIPVLWWVYDATVGVLLKCFCSYQSGRVQTPIL